MADYITLDEADAYAATTLNSSAWATATSPQKTAAIAQATREIDALPFQGQKYDPTQQRAFPRVAGDVQFSTLYPKLAQYTPFGSLVSEVWDWDSNANAAVVPDDVKRACFEQALSLIRDTARAGRLNAIADGVIEQHAGGVGEQYATGTDRPLVSPLCRNAMALLHRFRLRSGQIV